MADLFYINLGAHMKKTTIVLAMMLASSLSLQAKEVEVYGKINISAQSSDEGDGRFTELKSNASNFGVKGEYALEDGLKVVYQLEFGVETTSGASDKNIKARDQYLGLAGGFGEIRLGRHDTALKLSQGKIDQFNNYEADVQTLWQGENRLTNSISYFTPSFSGFSAQLSYIAAGSADTDDGISAALLYGDESLKSSNVYFGLAYDSKVAGFDTVRASAQVKVAEFKLGAMYQTQEAVISGLEQDGYLFSVAYPLDKFEVKAQYQALEDDNGFSVGADYKLGKNTKAFAWYSSFDFDNALDRNYFALGLEHKF